MRGAYRRLKLATGYLSANIRLLQLHLVSTKSCNNVCKPVTMPRVQLAPRPCLLFLRGACGIGAASASVTHHIGSYNL